MKQLALVLLVMLAFQATALGVNVDAQRELINEQQNEGLEEFISSNPLHRAAADGDLDEVIRLLAYHDPGRPDQYGFTAFHHAVINGHDDVVRFLYAFRPSLLFYAQGIGPHEDPVEIPAYYAVQRQNIDTLRTLINLGMRPDQAHVWLGEGGPLLFNAILFQNIPIIELLLNHGASLLHPGQGFATPLHLALRSGNIQMIHLLVTREIEMRRDTRAVRPVFDDNGFTQLHIAAALNDRAVAGGDEELNEDAEENSFAIPEVPAEDRIAIARLLIDVGHFPIDITNRDGETAAHVALAARDVPLLRFFIERHPAFLNLPAGDHDEPLFEVAWRILPELRPFLLRMFFLSFLNPSNPFSGRTLGVFSRPSYILNPIALAISERVASSARLTKYTPAVVMTMLLVLFQVGHYAGTHGARSS